jgi:hypothetical protein
MAEVERLRGAHIAPPAQEEEEPSSSFVFERVAAELRNYPAVRRAAEQSQSAQAAGCVVRSGGLPCPAPV